MPEPVIDFEGGVVEEPKDTTVNTEGTNPAAQEDATHFDGTDAQDVNEEVVNQTEETKEEGGDETETALEVGSEVEYDGNTYTVAENGDLVDAKGEVFKKADEIAQWLKENEVSDEEDLSIDSIRNAIGIDILDEQGQPVEFTNDAAGISSYVNAVMNTKANEISQGAINKLFNDVPLLREFIDYLQLNGSPRGFGDLPDRSGIELDANNEAQLVAVIKMAANEFGNASLNDNYINYLKSSGALYDEAKAQLENLVNADQQRKQAIAEQAEAARQQEQQELTEYWHGVSDAISKRVIAGYKIPETFVKEVNGQKVTLTPNDFYDYLSKAVEADEEGNAMTGYQRDLNNLSDEEALERELLDAWFMFTGGSYKDLVNMAVKEAEVKKLVVKARQQRATKTVKVVKNNNAKVKPEDILF